MGLAVDKISTEVSSTPFLPNRLGLIRHTKPPAALQQVLKDELVC